MGEKLYTCIKLPVQKSINNFSNFCIIQRLHIVNTMTDKLLYFMFRVSVCHQECMEKQQVHRQVIRETTGKVMIC